MYPVRKGRGFTIIELLVVIAVIGVLSAIIMFAVGQARANARDKDRIADLKQVELALALYREQSGSYPSVAQFNAGALAPTFVPSMPTDPLNTSPHVYTYTLSSGEFTLTARFESKNNRCYVKSQGASVPTGNPPAIPCQD